MEDDKWLEMTKSWLNALGYPKVLEFFECLKGDDEAAKNGLVTLVGWLEDRKIRALEVSERTALRNGCSAWGRAFQSYLETIECPFASQCAEVRGSRLQNATKQNLTVSPLETKSRTSAVVDRKILTWLLQRAIAYDLEDQGDCVYTAGPKQVSELVDPVQRLSARFGVDPVSPCTEDSVVQALQTIVDRSKDDAQRKGDQSREADLSQFPLGFKSGDLEVDHAAQILRMLYLSNLREVQDAANAMMIQAQEFTANPKTNSSLGKVGW